LLKPRALSGCRWNANWRDPTTKNSELHLLLMAYAPPVDQGHSYRSLLNSCLAAGSEISAENGHGHSAVFSFCDRLASLVYANHPDCAKVVKILLHKSARNTDEDIVKAMQRANWSGQCVFDIEHAPSSCLFKCIDMFNQKVSIHRANARLARTLQDSTPISPLQAAASMQSLSPARFGSERNHDINNDRMNAAALLNASFDGGRVSLSNFQPLDRMDLMSGTGNAVETSSSSRDDFTSGKDVEDYDDSSDDQQSQQETLRDILFRVSRRKS
jgi:hypothetical protein